MRILVAPDKFAGTMTSPEAARAIAEGWRRFSPQDELTLLPVSDGGPGFSDVMTSPPTPDAPTVFLESAQFCGPSVVDDPWVGSTALLGDAVRTALAAGAHRIVIGLGGTRTNDGGAGLLAALGASADVPLDAGPSGLRGISSVDLTAVRDLLGDVELIAAADVDVPLLGLFGATKTFGEQKGLAEEDLVVVDGLLDSFVDAALGSTPAQRRLADTPGAGAGGGLGFAILAAGGSLVRGIDFVADAIGLRDAARKHDLVLTGEGTYDHTSRAGKVVFGVGQAAAAAARPCVVLAGRVLVGSREQRAMGVDAAYAMEDVAGLAAAMAEPAATLADLAARVARTWAR